VDGADDLAAVDALQVDARDGKVGVPKLPLDNNQRNALVRHLDGVRVPQLMRREPATDPGGNRDVVKLCADASRRAWAAACRTAHDAEQPSDRQGPTRLQPWSEV
jgi:hypothetical protein